MSTTTDIVGLPELGAEEVDRSLLEVAGPMRVSIGLRLAIQCKSCRSDVPINGFADQVTCAGCGRVTKLDRDWWAWMSGEEAFAGAFTHCAGVGVEDYALAAKLDVSCQARHRRQAPHCHGCQQPLPEEIVDQIVDAALAGEEESPCCPGCGASVPVRLADDQVRSLCAPGLAVVSETLAEEAKGIDGVREFYVLAQIDDATRWYWLIAYHAIEEDDLGGVRLPAGTLERLADHEEPHIRAIAASGEQEAPDEVLARLAADKEDFVRRLVAENPRLPTSLLPRLASDDDSWVRRSVARDPRTPASVILKLAEDSDSEVREIASRRKERAWKRTEPCPVCGSEGFGQRAPCSSCGAQQLILSLSSEQEQEQGQSGAASDLGPLVQLGGEVASPDGQGFDLSLPGGKTVRVRTTRSGPQLQEGASVELLGAVGLEFDERAGGERLAAHQIPVVHARVVTSGADAAEQMARAIAELQGGRLIPMPPGLTITYEAPASGAWRLRLTARLRSVTRFFKRSWPLLLPAPLVMIFLGQAGGLNLPTVGVIVFIGSLLTYGIAAIDLNKPRITVDARTLRATPWPFPWKGAKSVATERVAQLYCECERNEEYSLRAKLTDGERLDLTEGRYDLEELFFIKRAVETVLGIPDRPVDREARPFGPHDRLALPATLKPRPRPADRSDQE